MRACVCVCVRVRVLGFCVRVTSKCECACEPVHEDRWWARPGQVQDAAREAAEKEIDDAISTAQARQPPSPPAAGGGSGPAKSVVEVKQEPAVATQGVPGRERAGAGAGAMKGGAEGGGAAAIDADAAGGTDGKGGAKQKAERVDGGEGKEPGAVKAADAAAAAAATPADDMDCRPSEATPADDMDCRPSEGDRVAIKNLEQVCCGFTGSASSARKHTHPKYRGFGDIVINECS